MEISGPIKIGILDNDSGGRELHLGFKDEFRKLNLQQQTENFQEFIRTLINQIHQLDETSADRQGMTTILQICQQLQPHIEANEIPLEETIVVNLEVRNPFGDITISH